MHIRFDVAARNKFLGYLLAVFLVYANGSWLFFEYPTFVKLGFFVFLGGYLVLNLKNPAIVSSPNLTIFFLILFPIISKLISFHEDGDMLNTISISLIYFILGCLHKNVLYQLLDKCAQVIYYLCVISIVFGLIFLANYSLLSILPVHYNDLFGDVNGYYNLLIYTDRVSNDFRTQSIFWEPGAWAFSEVFALCWYIFKRKQNKVLPVFFLGLLLTLSTTGIALALLLIVNVFIFSSDRKVKSIILKFSVGIVVILIMASSYLKNSTGIDIPNLIYTMTIDKLFYQKESQTAVSYEDRTNSSKKAFAIAADNPYFGIGRQSGDKIVYVTSSIFELLYQFGFLYTFVFIYSFRKSFSELNYLLSIPFVLILLNGEAYAGYIVCSIIVIYGAKQSALTSYIKPKSRSTTLFPEKLSYD